MKKNRKNVSIPHRYGTTNMEASSSYFSAKACRFLIGTVQLQKAEEFAGVVWGVDSS